VAGIGRVVIRDAEDTDLDGLVALEARSFTSDRIARRNLRRLIGRPTACLRVAVSADGVRGYCLVLLREGSLLARLYSIAVDADFHGAGLGRRLLADAERVAARRGRAALRLEVRVNNRRAVALYEKNGFRRIGRYDGYYADGADALRYEKPLTRKRGAGPGKRV